MPFEYLKEEFDDLQSEAILPDIIEHLENAWNLSLLYLAATPILTNTNDTVSIVVASCLTATAARFLE